MNASVKKSRNITFCSAFGAKTIFIGWDGYLAVPALGWGEDAAQPIAAS